MIRLLVVTYYFPPAGGAGVQRATKWVKYLPEMGVEPVVLTVREGAYPHRDETLVQEVAGTEVHRTAALDPFGLYGALTGRTREQAVAERTGRVGDSPALAERFARWARGNIFIPDARAGWVPFALAEARRIHRDHPVDAVLTTGPPHSVHLTGRRLKRTLGVPWVADFRDPWTSMNYYEDLPMTAPVRAFDKRLEQSVLQSADAVVTVSPALARQLDADGALVPGTVQVIHNGADDADFEDVETVRTDAFVLAHIGSLYAARNPVALWEAIRTLQAEGEIGRLVIRLVGRVGPEVEEAAEDTGAPVERVPYVEHDEAVREMMRSALLLLSIEPFESVEAERGVITGKLYEYLASSRPVLALGPEDGDAADILTRTDGGAMHARDDVAAIARTLQSHYTAWERGAPQTGATWESVKPYSRREGTVHLTRILNELVSSG
ncbi:MAG: glycosyltransferase [Rubricoccaceae bacterium]